MNGKINLLAVFLGLIISIFILFIGALSFGGVISSGISNVSIYVGIVLLAMAFFGSIVTGILGGKNLYMGSVNGAFLSLTIIVLAGFVLGILMFVFIGVAAAITNVFSAFASTAPTQTSTSSATIYNWMNLVECIILIILLFIAGIIGGAFGFYIKNGLKNI